MIELRAYAKINLTLDVLGLRDDGYHEIDSIVQTIGLYDSLTLERAPEMRLAVDGFEAPTDERNLVWQACVLLKERYGLAGGVSASITKRIPAQAGLGGGSSDAAAALIGTAQLYGIAPDQSELVDMAARLGSDVPFFLTGGTARMRGRGEIIEPLPDAPKLDLVIVWPGFGVSTAQAYRRLDQRTDPSACATDKALVAVRTGDAEGLAASVSNDFEAVVLAERPELVEVKSEMQQLGAKSSLLCGSGSAISGIMSSATQAAEAAEALRRKFGYAWAVSTIGRTS
jgi:4-diphosphocytidyl-2-C-methyl-D-erythritol kinase